MSQLIMWNLITLDGFFEGSKPWDLEWHGSVWGEEMDRFSVEQLKSADGLIFGRLTYEGMAAYWQTAQGEVAEYMNRLPKTVVSRTLQNADWAHTTLVKDDAARAIAELKRKGSRDLYVFGSANLSKTLVEARLFDEYRILVAPVIRGEGTPLFGRGIARTKLKLLEARDLGPGGVLLRYAPTE
jgi:dihydrofolate reductase